MTDAIRIPVGRAGQPEAWATVSLVDYERLIIHRWYMGGRGYAFRTKKNRSILMHREVLGFPDSEAVNHINGDKLDNRRVNLEACTHQHNVLAGSTATVYPQRDTIRALRIAGWGNQRIADELGIGVATVARGGQRDPPRHRNGGCVRGRWCRADLDAGGVAVSDLKRTYRCPLCGYDGFRAGNIKGTIDFSIQWACPRCMTADGITVWLEETSDPRDEAAA